MNERSLIIACPHCLTLNRVPRARLGDQPACGHCHRPLFTGQPLELDEAGFRRHVLESELPVLVDFWAPWCGPCRMMAPAFAAAAPLLEPRLRLAKLDTDAHPELAGRFAIRAVPTLILFAQGREIARTSGAQSTASIVRWCEQALTTVR